MDLITAKHTHILSLEPCKAVPAATFAEELAAVIAIHKAKFISGRLGIELDKRNQPVKVVYFDKAGQPLASSAFEARLILKNTQKHGIDLKDLAGLGRQLDAANICYRPYELYGSSGSNQGVDFDDLIAVSSFSLPFAHSPLNH